MTTNIAHRGFSSKYPENTMLAFEKAIAAGCDGIELDVQLSRDQKPVIMHDETLKRTTKQKGFVWDYSLRELQAFDASYRYGDQYGFTPIPSLREYCEFAADTQILTNIELKTGVNTFPGIEEKTLDLIQKFHLEDKVIISSFNHYSVLRFKKLAPSIRCGLLAKSWMVEMPAYAKRLGVEYIHPYHGSVTDSLAKESRDCGIGINAWTVNDIPEMTRLKKLNVASIITNDPDVLHALS